MFEPNFPSLFLLSRSTEKDYEEVGMDSGEGENEGGEEY